MLQALDWLVGSAVLVDREQLDRKKKRWMLDRFLLLLCLYSSMTGVDQVPELVRLISSVVNPKKMIQLRSER